MANKNGSQVSVVVPSYNEGERIVPVIEVLRRSILVGEIIVVDDGSDPISKDILRNLGGIKLIQLPTNVGKAHALRAGVEESSNDTLLFVDADLVGLTTEHIEAMIKAYAKAGFEMVLGDREKEYLFNRWSGISIALTGERILSKEMLRRNPELMEASGYLFEVNLNRWVFRHGKVGKVELGALSQTYKIDKVGWIGLWRDISLHLGFIKYLGIKEYLFQFKFARALPVLTSIV